jgi:hypothetical protein
VLPELLIAAFAAVPTVECAQRAEGGTAADRRRAQAVSVRVGPVSFAALRRARTWDFSEQRTWKAGLGVRAGRPVRVKIAAADRGWLALDYSRAAGPAATLRAIPCDPDTPQFSRDGVVGDVTGWPGGFRVQRNGCGTVLVRREGARRWRSARVAFGAPCE